ncbi:MAG: hypothetical protein WC262_12550 [Bacteroidales bacterium]|jgi:hypothetical protein
MDRDELRVRINNRVMSHLLHGAMIPGVEDAIIDILAPILDDAEKWRKLMSLFDISCDKCFLGHVCGTHRRSEAVCEDIKDALEGEGEKG